MGRLGGFSYRDVARRLSALGLVVERQGKASHEQRRRPATGHETAVPRHSPVPEGTPRAILR